MRIWFLVVPLALWMGMAGAQQPALTPRTALQNVSQGTATYVGTRAQHILLQDSLNLLSSVVAAYEQYVSAPQPKAKRR
jgi:hypothetical protein